MKLSDYRDPALTNAIAEKIKDLTSTAHVKFCHICGTHEYAVTHYGLRTLLPRNLEVIAGPGCPVCVVPARDIDEAVWLALNGVTVATFGDMLRVPGSDMSLADAKAKGGDVRVVYGVDEAVKMALKYPEKSFVFFAVGFETTVPANAAEILSGPPKNLSFLVSHRLIPPAMELLLGVGDLKIDGFICPGHVATVIGVKAFRMFPEVYSMPTVIAGFEPVDVMISLYMLMKQLKENSARVDNEYTRSVTEEGNVKAQKIIEEVFEVDGGNWRGIGRVPSSAYKLKGEYANYDARVIYDIKVGPAKDIQPGCSCHLVIIGKIKPNECTMFMKTCTPENPYGPCMVSHEGTCRIWAEHGEYQTL